MRLEPPGKGRYSTRTPPRTIWINDRVTSIRLEPAFWQLLREIARECGLTTKALIEGIIDTKTEHWPLTSALRLYIAQCFRNRDIGPYVMLVDQQRGTRRAHRKQEADRSRRMAARAQARS
jgi:predicted DNA-binding ribbon-helix-helix protein